MQSVKPIQVFTDGSSIHNGKPNCVGGWALAIPDFNGLMAVRYGQLAPPSSNNRGEIMGVALAAELFHNTPQFRAIIYSDSQYVVNSCNTWRHKWKLNNYEGVKNLDLLLPLFNLIDNSVNKPEIIWVKGHAGNAGNELADDYAGKGMRGTQVLVESATQDVRWVPEETALAFLAPWAKPAR